MKGSPGAGEATRASLRLPARSPEQNGTDTPSSVSHQGVSNLARRKLPMADRRVLRCAIYTRKSTEYRLDQEFNSLAAQREAAEAYIKSQAHDGWRTSPAHYDDGGISGGSLDRPAVQALLSHIRERKVAVL